VGPSLRQWRWIVATAAHVSTNIELMSASTVIVTVNALLLRHRILAPQWARPT
jgi:hypothetical protein